jgi:hypothetical protein
MDNLITVNKRVPVVATFVAGSERLVCQPVRMRHNNRIITFSELGLRHPTSKGKRMIHVFDVSDGTVDYRLEFDASSLCWTLVSMWGG